ncbi:hypothetical protein KJ640_06265 [bacterium]|nr:hypothetical protein [bacterium]
MFRSSGCGNLGVADVDKKVVLSGWVHKRRDPQKAYFIDLKRRIWLYGF